MTQELAEYLYEIIETMEVLVSDNEQDLQTSEVIYRSNKCENYDYDSILNTYLLDNDEYDPNCIEIDQNREINEEISREAKEDVILSEIEQGDMYKQALEILEKEEDVRGSSHYTTDSDVPSMIPSDVLLERFVSESLDRILEAESNELEERDKTTLVSSLTREIEIPRIEYDTTIWVYGVGAEFESADIGNGWTIEQPVAEDLESEYKLDDNTITHLNLNPLRPPTLKIRHSTRGRRISDISSENDVILSLLRLYMTSSVVVVGNKFTPELSFRPSYHNWSNITNRETRVSAILEEGDGEYISSMVDAIEQPVRDHIHQSSDRNHLKIAFDRYTDSTTEGDSPEEEIALSIMALEALYLRENEEGELSHRLAQRASLLLGYLDYEPLEVYNRINSGYSVRSSYVHGSENSDDFSTDLAMRTANFARKSIILFLQMESEYGKSSFINKIDNAIMSSNARDQFEDEIKDTCDYLPLKEH